MKRRILAVEDSPTQGEMLRYVLEEHGFDARLEKNGRAALAALEDDLPVAIITDILMPEMDGYELCRAVKAEEKWRQIPVILVTGLSDPIEVVRALECRADGFIVKPYAPEKLIGRVEKIIEDAAKHQQESAGDVELDFHGRQFRIGSSRRQILDLLLSTYETAVEKNSELRDTQNKLRALNESLEAKVDERTDALLQEVTVRRKAEERLTELNEALEERAKQLRQLAMALTRTEQAERQRLASILHDHLQQLLVAAKMLIGSQKERKAAEDHEEKLGRVEGLLAEAIEASRSLTVELCPPVLREGGLAAGLDWLCRRMKEKYELSVRCDLDPSATECPEEVAVFIFHAARELLFNTFKHSGVDEAEISLKAKGDHFALQVRDRGKGFDPAERKRSATDSFGLFSLEERTIGMGGILEIRSEPGEGTEVTVRLPRRQPVSLPAGEEESRAE